MSRYALLAALTIASLPTLARAQEQESASPPDRIDILAPVPDIREREVEECTEEQEAALLSGEIVVCRRFERESTDGVWNKEQWENRYARESMNDGVYTPVDVAGPGIFRGRPTIGGMCLIPPCPPPPALIIDVTALPEAPPGSDADRVARGLAPRGNDVATPQAVEAARARDRREELGLPQPPEFADAGEEPVSPAGSEAPEELP